MAIFTKYHAAGDPNSRLVRFEMAEITATLEMEKIQKKSRWAEWFATRGMRHRFFIAAYIPAMLQWAGNALTSYYLTIVLKTIGVTDSKTQLIINGCLSAWNFLTAIGPAYLVDRAGRRRLFLCGMAGMGVSYIIWTVCSAINQQKNFQDANYARTVLAMIFLYGGFYHVCSPVGITYIMEVVPYSLRSQGVYDVPTYRKPRRPVQQFCQPSRHERIGWKYYIVWCAAIGVHFYTYLLLLPGDEGSWARGGRRDLSTAQTHSGTNAMRHMGFDVNTEKAVVFQSSSNEISSPAKTVVEQQEKV